MLHEVQMTQVSPCGSARSPFIFRKSTNRSEHPLLIPQAGLSMYQKVNETKTCVLGDPAAIVCGTDCDCGASCGDACFSQEIYSDQSGHTSGSSDVETSGIDLDLSDNEETFFLDDDGNSWASDDASSLEGASPPRQGAMEFHRDIFLYKTTSLADLNQRRAEIAKSTSEMLNIPEEVCARLLQVNKWRQELVQEKYFDDASKTLQSIQLSQSLLLQISQAEAGKVKSEDVSGNFSCPICCSDVKSTQTGEIDVLRLRCGHMVCLDCFKEYVHEMVTARKVYPLPCLMDPSCKIPVSDLLIFQHASKTDSDRYDKLLARLFAESQMSRIKGCPAPGCELHIEAEGSIPNENDLAVPVSCDCAYEFCFKCGDYNHEPIPCSLARKWTSSMAFEDISGLWVKQNTSDCPECRVSIQKNDGCNHMTCFHCGHQFCWMCMGKWINSESLTAHRCSRITDADTSTKGSKNSHRKFWHYSPRYSTNTLAQKYHRTSLSDITSVLDTSQAKGSGHVHMIAAHKALYQARGMLAWCYVQLYYLVNSNQSLILEDNVNGLEKAVEALAQEIARDPPIPVSVASVSQMTRHVFQRCQLLRSFARDTKWSFDPYLLRTTEPVKPKS